MMNYEFAKLFDIDGYQVLAKKSANQNDDEEIEYLIEIEVQTDDFKATSNLLFLNNPKGRDYFFHSEKLEKAVASFVSDIVRQFEPSACDDDDEE